MSDILFRNGEVVCIRSTGEFGTIVCSANCQDDDILPHHEKALVLLSHEFRRDKDDNRLRDVNVGDLEKEYVEDPTVQIIALPDSTEGFYEGPCKGGTDLSIPLSSISNDYEMLSQLEEATNLFQRICDHVGDATIAAARTMQFDTLVDNFSQLFADRDPHAPKILVEITQFLNKFKEEIFP